MQYSVFIVDLSAVKQARLERALAATLKTDEDSVLICDLGPVTQAVAQRMRALGRQRPITDSSSFVL